MTTDAPLLLGRDGAVATIRFNRPGALDAIDVPMANSFLAAATDDFRIGLNAFFDKKPAASTGR